MKFTRKILSNIIAVLLFVCALLLIGNIVECFTINLQTHELQNNLFQTSKNFNNLNKNINELNSKINMLNSNVHTSENNNRNEINSIRKSLDNVTVHVHLQKCCNW